MQADLHIFVINSPICPMNMSFKEGAKNQDCISSQYFFLICRNTFHFEVTTIMTKGNNFTKKNKLTNFSVIQKQHIYRYQENTCEYYY